MIGAASRLVLDPLRAMTLDLSRLEGAPRRAVLRSLLALSAGTVSVEGAERLAAAPEPCIFALTHHNAWETVLAPAALIALRRGRRVRFLVDWMFVDLPWTGWLVRQLGPIPVYGKPARFRLRERHRIERRRDPAWDRALAALAAGEDVGVYPEGRRNPDPWLLAPPRRGLGRLALRSGVAVLPVGIDFPARERLRRVPRAGRLVLRIGEPLDCADAHAAWREAPAGSARDRLERRASKEIGERVHEHLARLARKVYCPVTDGREERKMRSTNERATVDATTAEAAGGERGAAPLERREAVVERVASAAARSAALRVVGEVYAEEKGWLADVEPEIAPDSGSDARTSWFLLRQGEEPVGVVRLVYDPTLELPPELGVELDPRVDLVELATSGRFVEIGRLMIRAPWRSRPAVVLSLMRAALAEVVGRGYTHLFTVVFEDDPHSPLGFHTRRLGFERVGTHRSGELACASRRILLVLDLARSYRRLAAAGSPLVAHLARGIEDRLSALG